MVSGKYACAAMGYRVSRFLSVSSTDTHDYFLYFLSTRWFAYEWVNRWVDHHFDALAMELGDANAVLIAAPRGQRRGASDLNESLWRAVDMEQPVEEALHSGAPALIVSRRPLGVREDGDVECAIVNLAAYDEQGISALFDGLIGEMQRGGDPFVAIPDAPDMTDRWHEWLKAFELKPNVFGLGLNGNAVIDLIRSWRQRRRDDGADPPPGLPRGSAS